MAIVAHVVLAGLSQERLGPAMAKAGVQAELRVTFHPAHEVYLPQAVTITG
jgi:hypothetical protein